MNVDELRDQLDELAGPEPRATPTRAKRCARRVRRRAPPAQRDRPRMSPSLAAVLVVAIVAAGVRRLDTPGSRAHARRRSTTVPPSSAMPLSASRAVPPSDVPSDVAAWATAGRGRSAAASCGPCARSIARDADPRPAVYRLKIGWFTRPFGIPTIYGSPARRTGPFRGDGNEAIDQRGRVGGLDARVLERPGAGRSRRAIEHADDLVPAPRRQPAAPARDRHDHRHARRGRRAGARRRHARSPDRRCADRARRTTWSAEDSCDRRAGEAVTCDHRQRRVHASTFPSAPTSSPARARQFESGKAECQAGRTVDGRARQTTSVDVFVPVK